MSRGYLNNVFEKHTNIFVNVLFIRIPKIGKALNTIMPVKAQSIQSQESQISEVNLFHNLKLKSKVKNSFDSGA